MNPRERLALMFGIAPPLVGGYPGWEQDAWYLDEGIDPGGLHVTIRDKSHAIIRRWSFDPNRPFSGWRFRSRLRWARRLVAQITSSRPETGTSLNG